MEDKISKRAEELDNMRLKGISKKLTLEEAKKIVNVWGVFLEHSGGLRILFGINIPRFLLPYPIEIIQGALNKMEAFYYNEGKQDRVKLLEETEMILIQFSDDKEAIETAINRLSNKDFQNTIIKSIKDYQITQLQRGYLISGEIFEIKESRLKELLSINK